MAAIEAPSWFFTKALSHRQKVLRLYKRSVRELYAYGLGDDPLELRYQCVVLRSRFDQTKDEKDMRVAKKLLLDGVKELWEKRHPVKSLQFSNDPYGITYDREELYDDGMLDNWTLVDREQYPYYFNKREKRKQELLEYFDKIEDDWDKELSEIQREIPPEPEPLASTSQPPAKQ